MSDASVICFRCRGRNTPTTFCDDCQNSGLDPAPAVRLVVDNTEYDRASVDTHGPAAPERAWRAGEHNGDYEMSEFKPMGLGDRVKDPVSGFTGIVTCVTTWLHGCIRLGVQPEGLHDGKKLDDAYFDQSQLVLVKKAVHTPMVLGVIEAPQPEQRRSNGGPARETAGFSR